MTVDYLARLRAWLTDTLWPPRCAACGRVGVSACDACLASLTPPPRHRIIGQHIDRLISAAAFSGVAEPIVHAFKYRGIRDLAIPLAEQMLNAAVGTGIFSGNPVIVPVPLHPSRLQERGYNQAELLARRIGMLVAFMVDTTMLRRMKPAKQQARACSREQRRENVANAFVSAPIVGRPIVLIDDVATTGATLDDCARALKEAGATSVRALTFARD